MKRSVMRFCFAFVLAGAIALITEDPSAAASAEHGKTAYIENGCWQCHGTMGQGSPVSGPKLAPDPIPLEAMSAFIRNSRRAMPPYREAVLPNQDLEDIHAYLSSIPKAADYKTIPLLAE